ncbi:MAG: segregation/condensation protein A [Candidatus Zambryskibacteria bacterium]|nr:segregation/condensation protein A [Candidatus Zambryskibacteria bacterium]
MKGGYYTVKTSTFEGPLDLLLDLVSKRKLFVNDVSLAQVTDDFIAYIEEHDEFPIGESAEFILIASTLMLIKSRSLLPMLQLTEEEEESIHDLEDRLALYAKVKELSATLKSLFGKEIIFEKTPSKNPAVVFSPDSKTDTANLLASLERVIESLPKKEVLSKVTVRKVVSLEEMIEKLAERISKASKFKFADFHGAKGEMTHEKKVSIIVGFLAMLELVKRGAIRVTQEGKGEIEIESESVNTPHYV